ncbi:S8 family serine peptidase [Candidatus Parcubacteria bacterium]|nr:S8 family serine peptidase [Candidatus Parcubacteria bacterium]
MKKIKIALGVVVMGVLVISGITLAAANGQVGERVYVLTDNPVVKTMLGVHHEFPGVFSTEVSPQLKVLTALGLIKTEPVQIYEITGKPICGDGKAHPSEQCGEPSLPDCPEGQICENCKCVEETTAPERICYPSVQKPWGIEKVNGGSGGTDVTVAVLDTGVYRDHLDLDVSLCKNATRGGPKLKDGCNDFHGHGTHTSGTVAANGGDDGKGIFGVAPDVNLWHIKVCVPHPIYDAICYGDDIAKAIRYVANKGTNIISISLSGDTQDSGIKEAIDYAVGENVLVVAAAGNDGPADGSIDYPAANAKVIAVGAIDSAEAVPDWSSRGINDGDYIIERKEVEFGAPGVAVESTWKNGCYNTIGGTSMAAPHIAGLAAKLWYTDAATTRTKLQELAKLHDLHIESDDSATGFGLPVAP